LKEAALQLGHVDEATFDRVVDPAKMVKPYVADEADRSVRAVASVWQVSDKCLTNARMEPIR
jgi:fumarate hydratase class II